MGVRNSRELGDNLFKIATQLLENARLRQLLKNTGRNPFETEVQEKIELLHKNLLVVPLVDEADFDREGKIVILIPNGKSPLNILKELEEETKNAWIFLHNNLFLELSSSVDDIRGKNGVLTFYWKATEEVSSIELSILIKGEQVWTRVIKIEADNIAFSVEPDDPEAIFFLKLEE